MIDEAKLKRMYLDAYDVDGNDSRTEINIDCYTGHPDTVTELWNGTECSVRTLDEVMFAYMTKDWE